jgi:hypothetical protein
MSKMTARRLIEKRLTPTEVVVYTLRNFSRGWAEIAFIGLFSECLKHLVSDGEEYFG